MSNDALTIHNAESGRVIAGLKEVEDGLVDVSIPLLEVAQAMSTAIKKEFADGGDPTWKPNAPDTLRRRKFDPSAPPLTDSGDLMRAASATEEGVKDSLFSLQDNILTLGVDRIDVESHVKGRQIIRQDGTIGGEPARPFMIFDEDKAAADILMAPIFDDYLSQLFRWTQG